MMSNSDLQKDGGASNSAHGLVENVRKLSARVQELLSIGSVSVVRRELITDLFAKFWERSERFKSDAIYNLSVSERVDFLVGVNQAATRFADAVLQEMPNNEKAIALVEQIHRLVSNNSADENLREFVRFENGREKPDSRPIKQRILLGDDRPRQLKLEKTAAERADAFDRNTRLSDIENRLQRLQELVVQFETVQRNAELTVDAKLEELSEAATKQIAVMEATSSDFAERAMRDYNTAISDLAEKKKTVEDLVGAIASGVMAGDYATSANKEGRNANWLRVGAILCMAGIGITLLYTFYETTKPNFQWESTLFRLMLSVFLSVPAAYLARESGKHRIQQYAFLQSSLDLKAITPYLASLPDSEQHRLKAEFAGRLFGSKDFSHLAGEAYPLNAQEIIMQLLSKVDKIEIPRSDKKAATG